MTTFHFRPYLFENMALATVLVVTLFVIIMEFIVLLIINVIMAK